MVSQDDLDNIEVQTLQDEAGPGELISDSDSNDEVQVNPQVASKVIKVAK